jgi:hypothetical protein
MSGLPVVVDGGGWVMAAWRDPDTAAAAAACSFLLLLFSLLLLLLLLQLKFIWLGCCRW